MFEELGDAIDGLDIPVDSDALVAVLALRDRLDARISDAVAAHDRAGLWQLDGATSMTAWLAGQARLPRPRAAATASRARKVAQLPMTADAWRAGELSSGQVEAIAANLDADTVGLFAEHEGELVPTLATLSVADVALTMRAWRDCATADCVPKPEPPQGLHLSRTLANRWRLDGDLGAETGELLSTALRLAQAPYTHDEPRRSVATRRADPVAEPGPALLPAPPPAPQRLARQAPARRHPRGHRPPLPGPHHHPARPWPGATATAQGVT
jgi:Domain of unknown function (DUF222)